MTAYAPIYKATYKRSNPNALNVSLASKLLAIILTLTVVMGLLVCGIDKAFAAPFPRAEVLVKTDQIKLGDVFDGLSQNADFVLAPAPQPGEELVWNQSTLLRIATAFNLPWRPAAADAVHIKRSGSVIDADTIRAVIRDHLAGLDEGTVYDVRFNGEVPQLTVPGDEAPQLQLVDFDIQPLGGTFSAIVRATAGGVERTANLRGVADKMQRVPVMRSVLKNGDIISNNDIEYVTLKASDLRAGAVLNAEDLVGTTPRRNLVPREVIRIDELTKPRLVNRGDLVTMVFEEHGMRLTARGRALGDGSMNDVIKVSNTGSNRMIEARVTNMKEVSVSH